MGGQDLGMQNHGEGTHMRGNFRSSDSRDPNPRTDTEGTRTRGTQTEGTQAASETQEILQKPTQSSSRWGAQPRARASGTPRPRIDGAARRTSARGRRRGGPGSDWNQLELGFRSDPGPRTSTGTALEASSATPSEAVGTEAVYSQAVNSQSVNSPTARERAARFRETLQTVMGRAAAVMAPPVRSGSVSHRQVECRTAPRPLAIPIEGRAIEGRAVAGVSTESGLPGWTEQLAFWGSVLAVVSLAWLAL